jgi:Ca2+-binding RTX toxin-like protein
MKRRLLWMLLMALALVLASGAALSATIQFCPNRSDGSCYGTKKADTMNGRPAGDDEMYGRSGDDVMRGYNGIDYLEGDGGKDALYGGKGEDELWGGGGTPPKPNDNRDDKVHGGDGNDYIYSGFAKAGVDRVFGGTGNDTIEAQRDYRYPKTKDIVNCGNGADDTVYFDRGLDEVKNCENKVPR